MFNDKIKSAVKVYIDDMVVKSYVQVAHLQGLQDIFDRLSKCNMRLSPI